MKKSILFILFLLLVSYSVFGQMTVSGKVVDENGGVLPSATVQIKGTTKGTMTDIDGNFEIIVDNGNDILVVRFPTFNPLEIIASEANQTIILKSKVALENASCRIPYLPLKINYWSGIFYNPYGISISKSWHYIPVIDYLHINAGYSTNFKENSDFYSVIGTDFFKRNIYYKFQQTVFNDLEINNTIITHSLESSSSLKYFSVIYGVGHQTFSKTGLENSKASNYGIHLGFSKYLNFASLGIFAKSFYWQDYWAWEANLNKEFYYRKLRLNTAISYRQTTQNFKEINLTLGYIF